MTKYRIKRDDGSVVYRLASNAHDGMEYRIVSNQRRYGEGDEVDTPDGMGVVADVITEAFEEPGGGQIDASTDSPAYAVLVEDEGLGVGYYPASDLSELDDGIPAPEDAEEELAEQVANADLTEAADEFAAELVANQEGFFEWPQSWVDSEQPARLIALKAFAGMNGSFDGCVREMRGNIAAPNRFCADFIDRLVGHPYWRGDSWAPGD